MQVTHYSLKNLLGSGKICIFEAKMPLDVE